MTHPWIQVLRRRLCLKWYTRKCSVTSALYLSFSQSYPDSRLIPLGVNSVFLLVKMVYWSHDDAGSDVVLWDNARTIQGTEGRGEAAIGVSHISAFDTLILFVLFLSQLKSPKFQKRWIFQVTCSHVCFNVTLNHPILIPIHFRLEFFPRTLQMESRPETRSN